MIIVYDLLNDQKVNLMGHRHNVFALQFTPNGQCLMSVDFDRNAELYSQQNAEGERQVNASTIILWDWHRGAPLQFAEIPNAASLSEALILSQQNPPNADDRYQSAWPQMPSQK